MASNLPPRAELLIAPRDLASALGIMKGDPPARPFAAPPIIVDTRPAESFSEGHIPGAIHLDLWGFSLIDTDE